MDCRRKISFSSACAADRGMGALTFKSPVQDGRDKPTAMGLADLVAAARSMLSGEFTNAHATKDASPDEFYWQI